MMLMVSICCTPTVCQALVHVLHTKLAHFPNASTEEAESGQLGQLESSGDLVWTGVCILSTVFLSAELQRSIL